MFVFREIKQWYTFTMCICTFFTQVPKQLDSQSPAQTPIELPSLQKPLEESSHPKDNTSHTLMHPQESDPSSGNTYQPVEETLQVHAILPPVLTSNTIFERPHVNSEIVRNLCLIANIIIILLYFTMQLILYPPD